MDGLADDAEARIRMHVRPRLALRALGVDAEGRDWTPVADAVDHLYADGWAVPDVEWAESCRAPTDPVDFAMEVGFVVVNSGMRFTVARGIFARVRAALLEGRSASTAFGHKGKAGAIDHVWANREALLAGFLAADDRLAYCESLPWIGGITKYHLAKNFGVDVAKPDVHLARLAIAYRMAPQALCGTLAAATGWRVATVDTLLWRACATGVLCGHTGRLLRAPAPVPTPAAA